MPSPALFICSAGNNGYNNDQKPNYPSSYPSSNIISVAATDQSDALASFSNYGPTTVDVAAPGTNILSTFPPWTDLFSDWFNHLNAWNSHGWSITNTGYYGVSPIATTSSPGDSAVDNSITLNSPVDLTSKCGTKLSFFMGLNNVVKNHALFYIEASRDGINWEFIDGWTGTTNKWQYESYNLTNYDTLPHLKIRLGLITDGNRSSSSSVYIDEVKLTAFNPRSAQQNYVFDDGTSMATPFVSGIAGLVKSMHPDYTNLQTKDAILKSVDVESSLYRKISTGGRVNADKAISAGSTTTQPLLITTPRLVHNASQHFERHIANTSTADTQTAPYAVPYSRWELWYQNAP